MRMTFGLSALALATFIHATPALAQTGSMAKPMPMAKEKTYTGCLAAGAMAGNFVLEQAAEATAMGTSTTGKESMGKDAMGKGMAAHTMALSSTAVDLSQHVGHQVSVTVTETGMAKPDAMGKPDTMAKPNAMAKPDAMAKPGAMAAPSAVMSVSSLKMIATKCGM